MMKKDMNKVTDTRIAVVNENSVEITKASVTIRSGNGAADKGRGIKGTKIIGRQKYTEYDQNIAEHLNFWKTFKRGIT